MNKISVVGIPFDDNSSYLQGAALAPPRIRAALHSYASNMFAENGLDLGANARWRDVGDLPLSSYEQIEHEIAALLAGGNHIVSLGGDHSITYPIIKAHSTHYPKLTIVQFDAHPDLYDELDGNRFSHACPFARIMEAGLATELVQIGIRTLTAHQREQVERFGVKVIEMRDFAPALHLQFNNPVYISLDLDALDPAFAPGVSHHEPGGLSVRDILHVIHNLKGRVIGADIVELNPHRDVHGMTATVAAKFLKEIISKILDYSE